MAIVGYTGEVATHPGEEARVHVSVRNGGVYTAELVRLFHGDRNPAGPGFKSVAVAPELRTSVVGEERTVWRGSYACVPDRGALHPTTALRLEAFIYATAARRTVQGLITRWAGGETAAGYALVLDEDGCAAVWLSDGRRGRQNVSTFQPVAERAWYFVVGSVDLDRGVVAIAHVPLTTATNGARSPLDASLATAHRSERLRVACAKSSSDLVLLGALEIEDRGSGRATGLYNGKLERPQILFRNVDVDSTEPTDVISPNVGVSFDFAHEITPDGVRPYDEITDVAGGGFRGTLVNHPGRTVTGVTWTGHEHDFRAAPDEYAAIHFHEDDLTDARWPVDFSWLIPHDLPSGVYAARLSTGANEDHVPFFVTPRPESRKAPIVLLAPTNTYLAYANHRAAFESQTVELSLGHAPVVERRDIERFDNTYGASLYDKHLDGSGYWFSSHRRPVLTFRPDYRDPTAPAWGLAADLHLVDWLHARGFEHDVITDRELHAHPAALDGCVVLVTATHPEYSTEQMLNAIGAFVRRGGNLMYLGGNGFYWVTAFDPSDGGVVEVRRWGGTESWSAGPGEYRHAFTGELGGLWRNRGRSPQKLVGVGFAAQGMERSGYYWRNPTTEDAALEWILAGVDESERIGDFGLIGDGAAGLEIDRVDEGFGTPSQTVLVASSERHTYVMSAAKEVSGGGWSRGDLDPDVRADMVYLETNGGSIFSVGSMAWCASLSENNYTNNISTITENVLRRFVQSAVVGGLSA